MSSPGPGVHHDIGPPCTVAPRPVSPAPAVVTNTYERPIPTPIDNLRPARDTCEQYHWPAHFSGDKQYVNTYFKSEEDNARWTIALLMKIGGGSADYSPAGGIHWHMNLSAE